MCLGFIRAKFLHIKELICSTLKSDIKIVIYNVAVIWHVVCDAIELFLPSAGPTINDPLLFTPGSSSTVTCTSTDSPATTVTFMRGSTTVGPLRDGESVFVGGVTYELAQTVTNRRESTYENILTINDDLANLVGDNFTCTVANILGMDTSQSITINGEIHHLAYSSCCLYVLMIGSSQVYSLHLSCLQYCVLIRLILTMAW